MPMIEIVSVVEGLAAFDVVGVAGNRRRVANQPGWAFIDEHFTRDSAANLSGCVAHGPTPWGALVLFGSVPAECELLDGILLASRRSTLVKSQVFFDTRFQFHFYDLDFCRTARERGLRLGTWPICLTHQSEGSFGNPAWVDRYRAYREKWGS